MIFIVCWKWIRRLVLLINYSAFIPVCSITGVTTYNNKYLTLYACITWRCIQENAGRKLLSELINCFKVYLMHIVWIMHVRSPAQMSKVIGNYTLNLILCMYVCMYTKLVQVRVHGVSLVMTQHVKKSLLVKY